MRTTAGFFGPGAYDMKASLVMLFSALEACHRLGFQLPRPVTVLATSDEEIGSPSSRTLIEDAGPRLCSCSRSGAPSGRRQPQDRQGCRPVHSRDRGQGRHAGVAPGHGASAILELRTSGHQDPWRSMT